MLVHSFIVSQSLLLSVAICFSSDCLLFCSEGYFPASGARLNGTGTYYGLGVSGYDWSTSGIGSSSIYGAYLYISSAWNSPLISAYRAYGFPVRCVQVFMNDAFFCFVL